MTLPRCWSREPGTWGTGLRCERSVDGHAVHTAVDPSRGCLIYWTLSEWANVPAPVGQP